MQFDVTNNIACDKEKHLIGYIITKYGSKYTVLC